MINFILCVFCHNLKNYLFIYLILHLAVLSLFCCMGFSLITVSGGHSLVAVYRFFIEVASLVVQHGLQAHGLQQLQHMGSRVLAHRLQSTGSVVPHWLSCPLAYGIFPDQGSNPRFLCLLYWQADTLPLSHQGNPATIF